MNKLTVEGNRNSLGPARTGTALGINKRLSGLDQDEINSMFPDAVAAIANKKAEFSQHAGAVASNRNSMLLAGDRSSLMMPPPSISAPRDDDFSQPMPSPWGPRSDNQRPKSASQQPMGHFSQPPLSAPLRSPRAMQRSSDNNIQSTTINAPSGLMGMSDLLSPYVPGASWASMSNTPMNATFSTQQSSNQADMVANATAMKLAALSTVNNRIQLDDVRKYRRARSSDDQNNSATQSVNASQLPSNFIMTNENGQVLNPQQVAMLQAQQVAALNGGQRSRPASPAVSMHGMHSRGLSGSHIPAYGNGFLSAYDSGMSGPSNGMGSHLSLGNPYNNFNSSNDGGYLSDASELNRGRSPRGKRGNSRPPEDPTDIELLKDIPAWLRSLRLHKYTDQLKGMRWQDLVMLDDAGLERVGVNALGARRKLTKVCFGEVLCLPAGY